MSLNALKQKKLFRAQCSANCIPPQPAKDGALETQHETTFFHQRRRAIQSVAGPETTAVCEESCEPAFPDFGLDEDPWGRAACYKVFRFDETGGRRGARCDCEWSVFGGGLIAAG